MEGDPTGTPEAVDAPTTTEVVRGDVAGDIQVITRTDDPAGAPAGDQPDPSRVAADEGADGDADAEATAAADAADRADLEQYPESVRDYLKGIPQEHRKTLHEHFGQRERERMLAEQERANKLEADAKAVQEQAEAVRATQGKFVGKTPIDLLDPDGNVVPGPTYDELATLLQTRRGRETLADKYGLSESGAEAAKEELDQRREMLTSSVKYFTDVAWGHLSANMELGLHEINGVDAEAVMATAMKVASEGGNAPAEVLRQVVAARDAEHAREMTAVKRDYDGRIKALDVNGEALSGRVQAAEARRLATGGRTGGAPSSAAAAMRQLARDNPEEYAERAKAGDFVGIDLTQ